MKIRTKIWPLKDVKCNHVINTYIHSHRKWKDNLDTGAKQIALVAYVKNQAILETILLYRASNFKQTKKQGSKASVTVDKYSPKKSTPGLLFY